MIMKIIVIISGGCPKINIPGFTYPVEEYYIEDIYETLRFVNLFVYLSGESEKLEGLFSSLLMWFSTN